VAIKALTREFRKKVFVLKMTKAEYEAAKVNSIMYADGNLSAWFRHAAINYIPDEVINGVRGSDDVGGEPQTISEQPAEK